MNCSVKFLVPRRMTGRLPSTGLAPDDPHPPAKRAANSITDRAARRAIPASCRVRRTARRLAASPTHFQDDLARRAARLDQLERLRSAFEPEARADHRAHRA